eukprot:scaffold23876_cov51-Attheya_sp.AAC.3
MLNSLPSDTVYPTTLILDVLPHKTSPAYPMAIARRLASVSMLDVFDKIPFPWQEDVIAHMNLMMAKRNGIPPAAVLLVQPMGGGKSLVCDMFAVAHGGIHWSISPLLSLTADQGSKLNASAIQDDDGAVVAVHLNFCRMNAQRTAVINSICSLPPDTTTTVMIFSSPQALTNVKRLKDQRTNSAYTTSSGKR